MFRYSFVLLVGASILAPVGAADSLATLFDTQVHDFGNVPVGPMLHHAFTIKNTTKQDLKIANLRVSCGCVTPSASTMVIPVGGTGTVNAQMDSRRFVGTKSVTVFVLFTQPQVEEVRLEVKAYGRTDIALNPDSFLFGQMRRGTSPSVSTQISMVGNNRITEATSESGYVQLSIKEPKKGDYGLTYEITAKMRSDIPVGKWYTDVWVKTDNNTRIRVPVTVEVESMLTVAPGMLQFDMTKVGTPITKPIVVKGGQPFKIVEIKGGDGLFIAEESAKGEAKTAHILKVTFTPGKEGDVAKSLQIITDLKEEGKVTFAVKGTGMP
jgi:hypothetical protein